jgi:hypothetical protein
LAEKTPPQIVGEIDIRVIFINICLHTQDDNYFGVKGVWQKSAKSITNGEQLQKSDQISGENEFRFFCYMLSCLLSAQSLVKLTPRCPKLFTV